VREPDEVRARLRRRWMSPPDLCIVLQCGRNPV